MCFTGRLIDARPHFIENFVRIFAVRFIFRCDDDISELHGRRYYDWLLQYGEDDEKGEFVLDTRGASVKVEQLLQDQELLKAMQMALNPVFKKDPAKFMDEYLTSRHFDPKKFDYSDDEWQKIVANMGKGDPRLAIAQMRAQLETKLSQMEQQFEAQENEKDRQNELVKAAIDERLKSTELTSSERETLAKIKGTLAKSAIEINAQKEITRDNQLLDLHKDTANRKERRADVIKKPAVEPRGRARAGQAFTQ